MGVQVNLSGYQIYYSFTNEGVFKSLAKNHSFLFSKFRETYTKKNVESSFKGSVCCTGAHLIYDLTRQETN